MCELVSRVDMNGSDLDLVVLVLYQYQVPVCTRSSIDTNTSTYNIFILSQALRPYQVF